MKILFFIFTIISLSACTLFSREFEITKLSVESKEGRLAISFYTMESLTELNKTRLIQFRCEVAEKSDIISGDVYVENKNLFKLNSDYTKYSNAPFGMIGMGDISNMLGYRYVAVPFVLLSELQVYDKLSCYVIGVTKSPLPFPMSNIIEITKIEIYNLL